MEREELLKLAKECGIDGLNPMGFYITDARLAWLERFAAAIHAKGYAKGAEAMRERAAKECEEYTHPDDFDIAKIMARGIRALPITPEKGEQGADV